MNAPTITHAPRPRRQLSLVDLFVAAGIMGVGTSLGLPAFLRHSVSAQHQATPLVQQRQASVVASTFNAAKAAGASVDLGSVAHAIEQLREGTRGTGSFSELYFRISIPEAEINSLLTANPPAVSLRNGQMIAHISP